MDNKTLLKKAKEAFKDKEYKTSLKYCKAVLKSDKSNYNAWVLVGASSQELGQQDQSEAAYKKAIDISPDLPLAWQGLCNLYEAEEKREYQVALISVYKKLVELQMSDKSKCLETSEKLITLVKKLGDKDQILDSLEFKIQLLSDDKEKLLLLYENIFEELILHKELNEHKKKLQIEALKQMMNRPTSFESCSRIISTCIEPLFKNGEEKHSLALAHQMYEVYPDSPSCLEFLCQNALTTYINNGTVVEGIKQICEKMSLCETTKGLSSVMQGFVLFIDKQFADAVKELIKGLETMAYYSEGWLLLANIQLFLHQYSDSEKSAKIGIQSATRSKASSRVIGKIFLILGQALSGRQVWDSAIKAFEKCVEHLGRSIEMLQAFCLTLLKIGHIDKAENMCHELRTDVGESAEVLQIEGYALLLREKYDEALLKLRQSVVKKELPLTLHWIALVLWESDQREKAFKVFLKAAELDPYFSKNFLYLGHYYANHLYDNSKAFLCYKKAFHLDSADYECGMSFSKVLKDLGKQEENIQVLKTITGQAPLGSCKWAWTQLGLYYLEAGIVEEAIISLQNALRSDPTCSYSWECLGDAYLKRGSYESALKAFDRAAELNTKAMYPLYQVSTIQKVRGFYVEAVEKYKNLLNIAPTYVPALIGLAETLILSAKQNLKECLYGLTKDNCEESLKILARAAVENPGLSCLWKLAGDACTIPYHLDEKWFPICVPTELMQNKNDGTPVFHKTQLLVQGSKFYGFALSLKEKVSNLWHDLGINYHFQSKLSDCGDKTDLAKKAYICLQKAVSISLGHSNHWTALGAIALGKEVRDYAFGQHALIKSLEINPNNAEAWTYLGVLYLENENIELAHEAFKKAQSGDPVYPLSWIGQAFIADKVHHFETMDLYRHATTLGSHAEALLGYSRAVCQTLLNASHKHTHSYKFDIEQMNAIVTAMDCAVKYTANNNNCPEAFNILGILYERQGIYTASLKAYERALRLFESRSKADDVEKTRINYARVLSVLGRNSDSLKELLLLKKVDVTLLCSFASVLLKNNDFKKAYKLFKQAFDMSQNSYEKSHIKVAMAMVSVNLQDPEFSPTLTLLLESSQIKPASVPGLLALYAHGMLKGEKNLALAAEKELVNYRFHKEYSIHIAFLRAANTRIQNGTHAARNEMLKMIHCEPNNAQMWMQMSQCLLMWDRGYSKIAAHCAKVAVFHGGDKEVASQVYALSQISSGYRRNALSAAQKAVHINPEKLTNWTTLAAACHVSDTNRNHTGWLFSFVKQLAKNQGIKRELLGWMVVMEVVDHISCEDLSSAKFLINQGLEVTNFGAEVAAALRILSSLVEVSYVGKMNQLHDAVENNRKSFFGWHILCQLLIKSDEFNEAKRILTEFIDVCAESFPKWKGFALLQLAALSYNAIHSGAEDKEEWLKTGETAVIQAVKISLTNPGARLLQGMLALESGNESLAKRSFERILLNLNTVESQWMKQVARQLYVPLFLKKKAEKDVLQELEEKFSGDSELKELVMTIMKSVSY